MSLLAVEHLTTVFAHPRRPVVAVNDVSLTIDRGDTLGLVGESGSGKSLTAYSILQLLPPGARTTHGRVLFEGSDVLAMTEAERRQVRGAGIGLIFQEPTTALNPVMRVGAQIAEALIVHGRAGRRDARRQAIELLRAVRIDSPEQRVDDYPFQLSGGMQQRVMIAAALACRPPLVIADEPTTALDVTVQAQILDELRRLKDEFQLSLLLITHDVGVIAETADRVAVMYAGRIVEHGPVRTLLRDPLHPYTRGLLASVLSEAPAGGARLRAIEGAVPDLGNLPPGCAFAPRCAHRMPACSEAVPALTPAEPARTVRCFLYSAAAETPAGGREIPVPR